MVREPVLPELRAATFAAVCLGLGAGAHTMMSGAAIPTWALAVGGLLAYLPARYAAGRGERGLLGIAGLMGGLQVAFHVLFSIAQHTGGTAGSSGSMPGMAMSAGMKMPAGMPMPAATAAAASTPVGLHMSSGMLLGHALAALVCAWWLRRGEAAVHALFRGAGGWIARHLVVPVLAVLGFVPGESRFAPRLEPVALVLRSQWLLTTRALRGPPASPSFT